MIRCSQFVKSICCLVVGCQVLSLFTAVTAAEPQFATAIVTRDTRQHSVPIEIDITDAKTLYLTVTDGGGWFGF